MRLVFFEKALSFVKFAIDNSSFAVALWSSDYLQMIN